MAFDQMNHNVFLNGLREVSLPKNVDCNNPLPIILVSLFESLVVIGSFCHPVRGDTKFFGEG